jgi:ABC-type uncharacterized transport system ATPase component
MTKEETFAKLNEQENKIIELQEELTNRPEKTVVQVNEVVIENSSMGGDIGALALALSIAQGEFRSIGKDQEGHGYSFTGFQSVVEKTSPILSNNRLAITQLMVTKMLGNVVLSGVKSILMHESGGWISSEAYIPTVKTKMNSTVQMFGVNTSYIKRYSWLAICGVATTEKDVDGRDD